MALKYRPEIDGLRALAIAPVVLYHAGLGLFSGGFVGVDIFFVISGFLITSIIVKELEADEFTLGSFYERRCRRIIPPMAVMAAITAVACWFILLPAEFRDFGRSLAAASTFWANIFFCKGQTYFAADAYSQPLLHTWSLSVEEQFYIVFPLAMMALFKWHRKRILPFLVIAAAISLMLSALMIDRDQAAVFYLLHFRAWELLLGSITALVPAGPRFSLKTMTMLGLAGLALLIYPIFTYSWQMSFPGPAALGPCLGTAILIHMHRQGLDGSPVGLFLSLNFMTGLGKISYSLYLWHWPLLSLPRYALERPLAAAEILAFVAAAILLSIISWKYIEQPFRQKKLLFKRKQLFGTALAVIAVLVLSGRVIRSADGFPSRLPAEALVYTAPYPGPFQPAWGRESEPLRRYLSENLGEARAFPVGNGQNWPLDFIVLGDSHAWVWLETMADWADEFGVSGLYVPILGLPLVDTWDVCRPNFRSFNESETIRKTLKMVRETGVKNVILGGYYRRAIGDLWGPVDKKNQPIACLSDDFELKSPTDAREIFADRMSRLTGELRDMGTQVWVLENAPDFSVSVPRLLARAVFLGHPVNRVGYSHDDYLRRNQYLRTFFDSLSGPYIHTVRIADTLCPGDWCSAGDENGPFYHDNNHVSAYGAHTFKDALRPIFESIKIRSSENLPPGNR